mmetsp:Transcript_159/g.430  ORF Transcript_159/g.430 Transcript_159/m.430 type:complete len:445 (-) Transcript_159:125-1459(-)
MAPWPRRHVQTVLALVSLGVCHAAIDGWSACGCSWTGDRCVVSSEEALRAHTQSRIDLVCVEHQRRNYSFESKADNKTRDATKAAIKAECEARFRGHGSLQVHRQCVLRHTKDSCDAHKPYCSWGAQQEDGCGISRSWMINHVVGTQYAGNPYVKFLLAQEDCPTTPKKNVCQPRAWCEWHPQIVPCTPSFYTFFMSVLQQRPDLLVFMQLLEGNAYCRGLYELTHRCSDARCHLEHGICMQRKEYDEQFMRNQMHVVQQLLCHYHLGRDSCESPCEKVDTKCKLPPSVPLRLKQAKANVSKLDWELYWKLLHLRSDEYQHRLCRSAHLHNAKKCGAVPICSPANATGQLQGSRGTLPGTPGTIRKDAQTYDDDDDDAPGYSPGTMRIISERLPLIMLAGASLAFLCLLVRDVDACVHCCRRRVPAAAWARDPHAREDSSTPLM